MTRNSLRLFVLSFLLSGMWLSACIKDRDTSAADTTEHEEQIRELDRQWTAAIMANDAEAVAHLFAEEGSILPPGAPLLQGRQAIYDFAARLSSLPDLVFETEPKTIESASSGELAYLLGAYTSQFTGPSGSVKDEGKYVVVWKRIDGEWKVLLDMFSSNLPPD